MSLVEYATEFTFMEFVFPSITIGALALVPIMRRTFSFNRDTSVTKTLKDLITLRQKLIEAGIKHRPLDAAIQIKLEDYTSEEKIRKNSITWTALLAIVFSGTTLLSFFIAQTLIDTVTREVIGASDQWQIAIVVVKALTVFAGGGSLALIAKLCTNLLRPLRVAEKPKNLTNLEKIDVFVKTLTAEEKIHLKKILQARTRKSK